MNTVDLEFENAMVYGSRAHSEGQFQEALQFRLLAFEIPGIKSFDRARAARDVAASFDRIGRDHFWVYPTNQTLAEAYSEYAYREHRPTPSADESVKREFTVSAMYAAVMAARRFGGMEMALTYIRQGQWESEALKKLNNGRPHQYDVNLIGRLAALEGFKSEKPKATLRALGREASGLANISQTTEVLGYNPSFNLSKIKDAQTTAKRKARGAKVIIEMQSLPTEKITKPIAWAILQEIL